MIKNALLLLSAYVLALVILPVGFTAGLLVSLLKWRLSAYLFSVALTIDQSGNVICQHLFNALLITRHGYRFGNEDEVISSVIGKNQQRNTLTLLGKALAAMLNAIDPGHTQKSIEQAKKRMAAGISK